MAPALHPKSTRNGPERHKHCQSAFGNQGHLQTCRQPCSRRRAATSRRGRNTIHEASFLSVFSSLPIERVKKNRYLKTIVLRDLAAQNRVEKVRTQGAFTAWLWRPKQVSPTNSVKPKVANPTVSSSTELTPAAVGVGEDWSHLNKRRQRARKMKVERDLQRMLEVQKMQRKAALQHKGC